MNRPVVSAVIAIAGLFALAGCSAASPTASAPSQTQKVYASSAAPTPTPSASASENLGPNFASIRADDTKPFGSYFMYDRAAAATTDTSVEAVYDYDKNLMVQVDRLGTVKPSSSAYEDGKASTYRVYRITFINNTSKSIDLGGAAQVVANDGDEKAAVLTDSEQGIGISPDGTLRPGRSIKWKVAFGDDKKDQVVTVSPYVDGYAFGDAAFSK